MYIASAYVPQQGLYNYENIVFMKVIYNYLLVNRHDGKEVDGYNSVDGAYEFGVKNTSWTCSRNGYWFRYGSLE